MDASIVYKYRPPSRINDLRSRTTRLTPPGQFNDPFEALPAVTGAWSPETLEALVTETHRLAETDGVTLLPEAVIAEFEEQSGIAKEEGAGWIASMANDVFGVVSLSEVPDDPLMWAHYAKSHAGFVIGFDATHPWFSRKQHDADPLNQLARVIYARERPRVYLDGAGFNGLEGQARWAAAVFGTKSHQWEYEQEVRLILPLKEADLVQNTKSGRLHLLRFPADLVREVIIGWRMSYDHRSALYEVLDDPSYRHVTHRRAVISQDQYEILLTEA